MIKITPPPHSFHHHHTTTTTTMCISFPLFANDVSCDKTQFFLTQDNANVRLLGLLPVKSIGSSAPSLLFFPVPSDFSEKIEPVAQVKCQAHVISTVMNPPMPATRSILGPSNSMGARIVKNQDGSVVCVLKSSSVALENIVDQLEGLLASNGINPRRVIQDKQAFLDQIGGHFKPELDMIVCVPRFDNNTPVVDGSGFSIQFVWHKAEFDGRIPLPGLVHNHAHDSTVGEDYHFVTYMPFSSMIFDGGIQVDTSQIVYQNSKALAEMHADLCEAAGAPLLSSRVRISNLKGTRVGGRTVCLLVQSRNHATD